MTMMAVATRFAIFAFLAWHVNSMPLGNGTEGIEDAELDGNLSTDGFETVTAEPGGNLSSNAVVVDGTYNETNAKLVTSVPDELDYDAATLEKNGSSTSSEMNLIGKHNASSEEFNITSVGSDFGNMTEGYDEVAEDKGNLTSVLNATEQMSPSNATGLEVDQDSDKLIDNGTFVGQPDTNVSESENGTVDYNKTDSDVLGAIGGNSSIAIDSNTTADVSDSLNVTGVANNGNGSNAWRATSDSNSTETDFMESDDDGIVEGQGNDTAVLNSTEMNQTTVLPDSGLSDNVTGGMVHGEENEILMASDNGTEVWRNETVGYNGSASEIGAISENGTGAWKEVGENDTVLAFENESNNVTGTWISKNVSGNRTEVWINDGQNGTAKITEKESDNATDVLVDENDQLVQNVSLMVPEVDPGNDTVWTDEHNKSQNTTLLTDDAPGENITTAQENVTLESNVVAIEPATADKPTDNTTDLVYAGNVTTDGEMQNSTSSNNVTGVLSAEDDDVEKAIDFSLISEYPDMSEPHNDSEHDYMYKTVLLKGVKSTPVKDSSKQEVDKSESSEEEEEEEDDSDEVRIDENHSHEHDDATLPADLFSTHLMNSHYVIDADFSVDDEFWNGDDSSSSEVGKNATLAKEMDADTVKNGTSFGEEDTEPQFEIDTKAVSSETFRAMLMARLYIIGDEYNMTTNATLPSSVDESAAEDKSADNFSNKTIEEGAIKPEGNEISAEEDDLKFTTMAFPTEPVNARNLSAVSNDEVVEEGGTTNLTADTFTETDGMENSDNAMDDEHETNKTTAIVSGGNGKEVKKTQANGADNLVFTVGYDPNLEDDVERKNREPLDFETDVFALGDRTVQGEDVAEAELVTEETTDDAGVGFTGKAELYTEETNHDDVNGTMSVTAEAELSMDANDSDSTAGVVVDAEMSIEETDTDDSNGTSSFVVDEEMSIEETDGDDSNGTSSFAVDKEMSIEEIDADDSNGTNSVAVGTEVSIEETDADDSNGTNGVTVDAGVSIEETNADDSNGTNGVAVSAEMSIEETDTENSNGTNGVAVSAEVSIEETDTDDSNGTNSVTVGSEMANDSNDSVSTAAVGIKTEMSTETTSDSDGNDADGDDVQDGDGVDDGGVKTEMSNDPDASNSTTSITEDTDTVIKENEHIDGNFTNNMMKSNFETDVYAQSSNPKKETEENKPEEETNSEDSADKGEEDKAEEEIDASSEDISEEDSNFETDVFALGTDVGLEKASSDTKPVEKIEASKEEVDDVDDSDESMEDDEPVDDEHFEYDNDVDGDGGSTDDEDYDDVRYTTARYIM